MGGEESAPGRVIFLALQVLVLARVGPSPADKRNQITAPKTGSKNDRKSGQFLEIHQFLILAAPKICRKTEPKNEAKTTTKNAAGGGSGQQAPPRKEPPYAPLGLPLWRRGVPRRPPICDTGRAQGWGATEPQARF